MKKLYRSQTNKVLAGICGGIGEYFDIDPVIVRVIFAFFFVMTGFVPFGLLYVILIFVIPQRTNGDSTHPQTPPAPDKSPETPS